MSQMQNVRALAQKLEEFLNTDMSNSRDVLQRKFREEEECIFAPVCSEGNSRSSVNPAPSFMSSKKVQIFITLINITALRNITQVKSSETNNKQTNTLGKEAFREI